MTLKFAIASEAELSEETIVPMPDPPRTPDMEQFEYLFDAVFELTNYFEGKDDVVMFEEAYLCRDTRKPSTWVVPDLLIAIGVNRRRLERRRGYVIPEVGKPPDFVMEIASETTGRIDYTVKRQIYEDFEAGEYWRFDCTGGRYHDKPLAADILVDGEYQPMEMEERPDGSIRGYSPALGLYLCWEDGKLRFYDPVEERYLPNMRESNAALAEAESRADMAELRADTAESRVDMAERRADTAEQRANAAERRARTNAEELLDAEAEIRRLREELRGLGGEPTGD